MRQTYSPRLIVVIMTAAFGGIASGPALAVVTIGLELVADGLTAPNLLSGAGDGSGRLFILDQSGQIRIVDAGGTLLPAPFLDIASRMVPLGAFGPGSFDERGLLGLAFHPNYVANGKFYVYYSAPQPAPDPITFEAADSIPSDVTFTGGIIGTQFIPPLYCSGTRAFEVAASASATIEFDEPVIKTRFFLVHRLGAQAGSVEAFLADGSSLGSIASNVQSTRCAAQNFVEIEDFGFPVQGIRRLELQAGTGTGLVLFLDDLEITRFNHKSRVSEFTVTLNPDIADPSSEQVILEIDEPQFNHNSGTVAFGPDDGMLYVSVGDGGNGNDVGPFHNTGIGNGQDVTRLLGSILRINVDADDFPGDPNRNYAIPVDNSFASVSGCSDGCDEIWAYGLRNAFRFSFDSGGTRRLFCGDTGQDLFEEVSIIGAGQNMGWNTREGLHCFDPDDPFNPPAVCPNVDGMGNPLVDPIMEYPHFEGGVTPVGQAVIGGNVYRGSSFPGLSGIYVFGDFSLPPFGGPADGSVFLGTETFNRGSMWERTQPIISTGTQGRLLRFVNGFGQDDDGEVYVCTTTSGTPFGTTGAVFKVVPTRGDLNRDGHVDLVDFLTFAGCFGLGTPNESCIAQEWSDSNLDGVGSIDLADFLSFAQNFTG